MWSVEDVLGRRSVEEVMPATRLQHGARRDKGIWVVGQAAASSVRRDRAEERLRDAFWRML